MEVSRFLPRTRRLSRPFCRWPIRGSGAIIGLTLLLELDLNIGDPRKFRTKDTILYHYLFFRVSQWPRFLEAFVLLPQEGNLYVHDVYNFQPRPRRNQAIVDGQRSSTTKVAQTKRSLSSVPYSRRRLPLPQNVSINIMRIDSLKY